MNIHEYQGKQILKKYGVNVPRGRIAHNGYEARAIANEVGGNLWAIKAQVLAGGRGKGGGVKIARNMDEVLKFTDSILGMTIVTKQTGPQGKKVMQVYVEEGLNIKKEYYIALVLDRTLEMPVFIASCEGGMEIEEIAAKSPEKIVKVPIDPTIGFCAFHSLELALALGLDKVEQKGFYAFANALYNVFINEDAEQVEINPMVLSAEGEFVALDAKLAFDNNALFRHPDIGILRDFTAEEPSEIEASQSSLNYIKLEGNVGCMVNGAGLAMATMDIIKYEGGEPANFLDVGGGANAKSVAKGFEIILRDKNVKAIFVNIFGGIVQCDRVAEGIIEASKVMKVNVPVIVRLDGTNAAKAREILNNSGIGNLISANDLRDGAKKAVEAAKSA